MVRQRQDRWACWVERINRINKRRNLGWREEQEKGKRKKRTMRERSQAAARQTAKVGCTEGKKSKKPQVKGRQTG